MQTLRKLNGRAKRLHFRRWAVVAMGHIASLARLVRMLRLGMPSAIAQLNFAVRESRLD